jgi:hypothetical protein
MSMSIGSLGFAGIAPGAVISQPASDTDRAQHDVGAQQLQLHSETKAEQAAGIGQTDGEEHETAERDADGRRPWELPPKNKNVAEAALTTEDSFHSKDASGDRGNELDLTG